MARRLQRKQILAIRRQHLAGNSIKEIAEVYEKSESAISRLVHGHSYKNVIEMDGGDLPKSPAQESAERREFLRKRGF